MPRIARKNSQSCFYHVIVQGMNKEYIFEKEEYIKKYKEIIQKKLKDSNIKILAYCIMNNHAHFLIFANKSEYLSKYMQKINTAYSNFYNKTKKRVGYVFRDRYYSRDILTLTQLYNCVKYIHMNPVKANISKSVKDYQYSSYNEFLGEREIIDSDGITLLFGTSSGYEEEFSWLHSAYNNDDDESDFFDVKEKEISEFIIETEKKYQKKIVDIKMNKEILQKVIKEARQQTNVTIVELANILDISKSTVEKYSKK